MKTIGFIAMSGVRAHNPELTKLGLTLPGFVERNKIIASLPSLGLLTLAGLTPSKFRTEYYKLQICGARKTFPITSISSQSALSQPNSKRPWRSPIFITPKTFPS